MKWPEEEGRNWCRSNWRICGMVIGGRRKGWKGGRGGAVEQRGKGLVKRRRFGIEAEVWYRGGGSV